MYFIPIELGMHALKNTIQALTVSLEWSLTLILPTFQNYEIYRRRANLPYPTISKSSSLTKKLLGGHFNYK